MNATRSSDFDRTKIRFAELLKALAHPERLAILGILSEREECMCENISNKLPLTQSTVSQHLKVLKEAGLIHGKITGVSVCYDLNPETFRECCSLFDGFAEKMLSGKKVQFGVKDQSLGSS